MTADLPGLRAIRPDARLARVVVHVVAGLLALAGVAMFVSHLQTDPLVDARAYWDAGRRLNEGLPLYEPGATSPTGLYLYPPLLAILFRPLALLPFEVAGPAWSALMVAALLLTVRRLGLRRPVLLALGCLGMPIGWALAVGQVEPLLTLLLTLGNPWSIALAGHLKIVPWLAAAFWLGRRDWRSLRIFSAWLIAVGLVQLLLEPEATLAYLRLEWTSAAFGVRSFSPYAIHPAIWVVLVIGLVAMALWTARRPGGWRWSVALATLVYPRFLMYQLMSFLAVFGGPVTVTAVGQPDGSSGTRPGG